MKNKLLLCVIAIAAILNFTSCLNAEDKVGEPPVVAGNTAVKADLSDAAKTYMESKLTATEAEIVAVIDNKGNNEIKEYGAYVSSVENFSLGEAVKVKSTNLGSVASGFNANAFSVALSGLENGTRYYYRFYVTHSRGTSYSELSTEIYFETLMVYSIPTVSVSDTPSVDIVNSEASIDCKVESAGNRSITECGLYYKKQSDATFTKITLDPVPSTINTSGVFNVTITGLQAGAVYDYKAFAVNEEGEGESAAGSFRFGEIRPQLSLVGEVTDITGVSAKAEFKLDVKGNGAVTDYGYYINGVKTSVGANDIAEGSTFIATITGLAASTKYTIYGYAVNEDGETNAADAVKVTFQTLILDKYDPSIIYNELPGVTKDGNTYRFLDRNLGATAVIETGVAPADNAQAGWFIQWGRKLDGYQLVTAEKVQLTNTTALVTTIPIPSDDPMYGKFIFNNAGSYKYKYFFQDTHTDCKTWWSNQAGGGTYNPCPNGYRVPTKEELEIFWTNRASMKIAKSIWFRSASSGDVLENATTQGGWYHSCSFFVTHNTGNYLIPLKIVWSTETATTGDFANNAVGLYVRCVSEDTSL